MISSPRRVGRSGGACTDSRFPGAGDQRFEGPARTMMRISTIFIAICMVLVAASLGLVLYSVAGISGMESAIVALTALTFLILYNAVSMRLRDRTDVGSQIADLSRGTRAAAAHLARQVPEFGRRLAAVEGRITSSNSIGADRIQAVVGEINELGGLVKQLAASVANHEDLLSSAAASLAPTGKDEVGDENQLPPSPASDNAAPAATVPTVSTVATPSAPVIVVTTALSQAQILTAVRNAVEENRLDLY